MPRIRYVNLIRHITEVVDGGLVETWRLEDHYIPIVDPPLFLPIQVRLCPVCGRFFDAQRANCSHCGAPRRNGPPTVVWAPTGFRVVPLVALGPRGEAELADEPWDAGEVEEEQV